ncbi:Restriction endonuclease, type II, XamI [Fimbriimonadaceae bacterium]
MPINADKPHQWKEDVSASVDMFNTWFMHAAPAAFRETRMKVTGEVEQHLLSSSDGRAISASYLRANPQALATLRMATCPPLARERLSGLAGVSKTVVESLEAGKIPRIQETALHTQLEKVAGILVKLMDDDLFPWLTDGSTPSETQRYRAATILADRCCTAVANPIVKNAQEARQLRLVKDYLEVRGYKHSESVSDPKSMVAGTFSFRMNVPATNQNGQVNIPVDIVIQPKSIQPDRMPILIEAKSAGDFTNVNKRRKEEAQKVHQIRATYGPEVPFYLFLCGYFDAGYLGYSASEGIDWIWEHRLTDLDGVGL